MRASRFFTVPALAALVSLSSAAFSAPSAKDKADAKALAGDAKKAMKDKRWADALTALKKADKLDPSPALELDLAQAQIGAGKLVEASKTLAPIAADGTDNAQPVKKAREAAKKMLDDLKPRVPTVKVTVIGPPGGKASTLIDGVEVDGSGEIPVNPGDHTVGAAADGFVSREKEVHLGEGAREQVDLTLAPSGPVVVVEKKTGSRLPGAIVTGVGGAGLLLGGIFGGLAFSATSSAKAQCHGNLCPPSAANDISRSKTFGNVSTAMFIAGGAIAATGVVLIIVAPGGSKSDEAHPSAMGAPPPNPWTARVAPWVGPGGGGLSATGSF